MAEELDQITFETQLNSLTNFVRLNRFVSYRSDSSTVESFVFDTSPTLSTAGAELFSIKNAGTEKFALDKDGKLTLQSGLVLGAGITVAGNIVMADNSITGIDTLTFTDAAGTIAGIQNQNLLDKTATETITGAYQFNNNISFDTTARTIAGIQNGNLLDLSATEEITGLYTFSHASGLKTDKILENTAGVGITADSVLFKDGNVEVNDTVRGTTGNGYLQLLGDSGASNGIKLYDDGVFEAPTQSGFRAYRDTSNQSISASTTTKVQFQTENFDEQAEYDNATNYDWTAERAGKYLAVAQAYWTTTGAGDSYKLSISLNTGAGSNEIAINLLDSNGGALSQPVTTGVLELAAGDVLHVQVWTDAGAGGTISTGTDKTFFSVFKIA